MSNKSIVVIGAGLAGLYLTYELQKQGKSVVLVEARDRPGGRILSLSIGEHKDDNVDLGPAWVWPQLQPRLSRLLNELELSVFKQFTDGEILFQQHDGSAQRYSSQSAHAESYRIAGGNQRLVDTLYNRITANPQVEVIFNTRVHTIDQQNQEVLASQTDADDSLVEYAAKKVISTLPLRLLANSIKIQPELESQIIQAWHNTPTWMAAHCKLLFIYDTPFWREQGLSAEVFSQRGPLSEIYDATPYIENSASSTFALTSFVGLNAMQRQNLSEQQLKEASLAQLVMLFGEQAGNVKQVIIKDWSHEPLTSTATDLTGRHEHPHYDESLPKQFLDGFLSIAGTETAVQYAGYIEGALESVEQILSQK